MIFKNNILVKYQTFVIDQSFTIYNDDYPAKINFRKTDLQKKAILSLILPGDDKQHKYLTLTLMDVEKSKDEFAINEKQEIEFIINKKNYKLTFIGILSLYDQSNFTDPKDVYQANTARLKLTISDQNSEIFFETSGLIRNRSDGVSDEVDIKTYGPDFRYISKSHVVQLKYPIPFFLDEIIINVQGYSEPIHPYTDEAFPFSSFNFDIEDSIPVKEGILDFDILFWKPLKSTKEHIETRMLNLKIEDKVIANSNFRTPVEKPESSKIKELCLIISNTNFHDEHLTPRTVGGEEDVNNIKEVFEVVLKYHVEILKDLETSDLIERINRLISNKIRNYHQNVVVFVLSHGNEKGFSTFDDEMTFEDLVKLFLPENCPALENQEKIFFYSLCLGKCINTDCLENLCVSESESDIFNFTRSIENSRPKHSNIFEGFSTIKGYISLRDKDGSIYIKELLKTIRQHPNWTLLKIHHTTQIKLSKKNWELRTSSNRLFH